MENGNPTEALMYLTHVVQYMGRDDRPDIAPFTWRTMAAFDNELTAERYAVDCGKNNTHWQYRAAKLPEIA